MGRDDALEAIEAALKRYEGRVAITALHSLRGIGKTTLAAVFADRHRSEYRATWWVRAQAVLSMRADLVALGVRLGWVAADDKEDIALAAVMERLRHEGEGILLIYDDAIDAHALKPYLPRGGAARVHGAVHNGDDAGRRPRQGARRAAPGRETAGAVEAEVADRRRTRLSAAGARRGSAGATKPATC
jgi:hypothetical protein